MLPKPDSRRQDPTQIATLWRFVIVVALCALCALVFSEVRWFGFTNWDDPQYVTENPFVQQGLSPETVRWAFTTTQAPYWHPVTWLSHLADSSIFGPDSPGSYHLVNVAIHVINTILVLQIALALRLTGGAAAFIAAVFAVHPLHVESVVWIAERKDVLSALFGLSAILLYLGNRGRPVGHARVILWVLFGLALMAKPMMVTIPVLLLLLDYWPLRRWNRSTLWHQISEKLPLFVMAIAVGVATVVVQVNVGAAPTLATRPLLARVATALMGYVGYIAKTIWPTDLSPFYPFEETQLGVLALAALGLAAVSGFAWRQRLSRPYILVGWAWFGIMLAPVIGLVQAGEQAMADRFSYLPMLGLLFAIVPFFDEQFRGRRRSIGWAATSVAGLVSIGLLASVARLQASHWVNSVSLWQHAIRANHENYLAHQKLAEALRDQDRLAESEREYREALRLAPARSPRYEAALRNGLGLVLARLNRATDAVAEFSQAVSLDPNLPAARNNLGSALGQAQRFAEAAEQFAIAVRLEPSSADARYNLAVTLLRQGLIEQSRQVLHELLAIQPTFVPARRLLERLPSTPK